MVTVVLELLAAALLLFLVAAAATGRLSGLADAEVDRADTSLPEHRLSSEDVDRASFTMAFRGYRMEEVDTALDRVVTELRAREQELEQKDATIAALTSELDSRGSSPSARSSAPVASFTPQPVAPPTIAPPLQSPPMEQS